MLLDPEAEAKMLLEEEEEKQRSPFSPKSAWRRARNSIRAAGRLEEGANPEQAEQKSFRTVAVQANPDKKLFCTTSVQVGEELMWDLLDSKHSHSHATGGGQQTTTSMILDSPKPSTSVASVGTNTPQNFLIQTLLSSRNVKWCSVPLGSQMDFKWSLVPVFHQADAEEDRTDRQTSKDRAERGRARETELQGETPQSSSLSQSSSGLPPRLRITR
jgi:hypothetical protein